MSDHQRTYPRHERRANAREIIAALKFRRRLWAGNTERTRAYDRQIETWERYLAELTGER